MVGVAGLALTGCPTSEDEGLADEGAVPPNDPGPALAVSYRDPGGRFEIEFPAEPVQSEDVQIAGDTELVVTSLAATLDGGEQFILAWSDAPAGAALVRTQAIRAGTAEENAVRDGGTVVDERETELFGRAGLEFEVEGGDRRGFYHDAQVVLGGRLYELTVVHLDDSRESFDRFVASFRLLQPPLEGGADFFAAAESLCATAFGSLGTPPEDATPAERGAAVSRVSDVFEDLVAELSSTPANAAEQGDAAAFIDAMRRTIGPGRTFAEAIAAESPDAEALGNAIDGDTELIGQLADAHGARSCA